MIRASALRAPCSVSPPGRCTCPRPAIFARRFHRGHVALGSRRGAMPVRGVVVERSTQHVARSPLHVAHALLVSLHSDGGRRPCSGHTLTRSHHSYVSIVHDPSSQSQVHEVRCKLARTRHMHAPGGTLVGSAHMHQDIVSSTGTRRCSAAGTMPHGRGTT